MELALRGKFSEPILYICNAMANYPDLRVNNVISYDKAQSIARDYLDKMENHAAQPTHILGVDGEVKKNRPRGCLAVRNSRTANHL